MGTKIKLLWIATILITIFIVLGAMGIIQVSGEIIPEIDQNQVEDEISKTIRIQLEDGISSSDDLR